MLELRIGLRIDVDTFRGTRYGVPGLCEILANHSITGSFFFSVGPDNMGRHLWRMIKPAFLVKMLRTKAASLYGWDILLRGTFWPGPIIGKRLAAQIRAAAKAGHEIGYHAWDHHAWQIQIDSMDATSIRSHIRQGVDLLSEITGRAPTCSAAPAWKCTDVALAVKSEFPFVYNSDCRGNCVFRPILASGAPGQPQVPVTLPTYDESVGRNGIDPSNYNDYMLSLLNPDGLNVLTIHAEAEGCSCRDMFNTFIRRAKAKGAEFVPLGQLVADPASLPTAPLIQGRLQGREGWISCQGPTGRTAKQ